MKRIFAIGDVHGCYEEFEALLDKLDAQPGDRVIQLGDLVNRGPNSHRAVQIARQREIECVVGNHELRLLQARRSGSCALLSEDDLRSFEQLNDADWQFIEALPRFLQEPEIETVFVHGGFLPGEVWYNQTADVVANVQHVHAKTGELVKRSQATNEPFWADIWKGKPYVVYGHTPRRHIYPRPGSLGIDTGCIYGGYLTAFVLPERTVLQVPALRAYQYSRHIEMVQGKGKVKPQPPTFEI